MASKSLYLKRMSLTNLGEVIITKFDKEQEFLEQYTLILSNLDEWLCSCPARIMLCRHIKMLKMFKRAEAKEDVLFNEVSENGKYVAFLAFDGKTYDWVKGSEIEENNHA